MASAGKIPEYKPEDVGQWLGRQSASLADLTEVLLWFLPVLGLMLMLAGFWQVAKESREAALGGGGKRYGWWMVIGGGGVASAAVLMFFLAGFLRPPGT